MSPFPQDESYFERANESVMTRTMDGIINFWNRSAEKLYGWRKEEAIGKVSHALLKTQFPKPLEEIESELVRNGRWKGILVHTTRDGDRLAVESRWTLDPTLQPGAIVEINARTTEPEARADIHSVSTGRREPGRARKIKEDKISEKLSGFANIVLASGGLFCVLVSLYIFYQYGWSGQKQFASRFGIVAYFVFPLVLATLFFLSLRLRRIHKLNIAIFGLSGAISVYGAELFLTFSGSAIFPPGPLWDAGHMQSQRQKNAIIKLAKQFGVEFDTRSKLEVINELRQQGIEAVPNVFPRNLFREEEDLSLRPAIRIDGTEILPFAGISNKVTVLCNENGAYTIYDSDEHGFHNPTGIWNLDHIAVAAVGDSFTHGACVSSDRNFVALLRTRYPATLNLGMSGNGPLLELATLKEYLPRFRPKVVLWLYFEENDLEDLKLEMKNPLLRSYLEGDFNQGLLDRQSDIDKALKKYVQEQELLVIERQETQKSKTINLNAIGTIIKLSALRENLGLVYGQTWAQDVKATVGVVELDMFREILSQAKASVGAWGGRLYFVYLPDWYRYGNPRSHNKNREPILRLAKSLNVPIIDLHPAFQAQRDPLSLFPFRRFGHYNDEGHRLVAESVLDTLSSANYFQ